MSKILDLLTEVAIRSGKELNQDVQNNQTLKEYSLSIFNKVYPNFNASHPWPWTERTFVFQTVPNYVTGTLTATNGSRTITGSGTSFTSAMVGRFLKLDRDNEIYEILSVETGTSLTLSVPFAGSTASLLTYLIWKRYYECPPDMLMMTTMEMYQFPRKAEPIRWRDFTDLFNNPYQNNFPNYWSWYGVNSIERSYSTGTVTVTQDSKVMIGVGTSWLDNVLPGSKITIGDSEYNVDRVDSDTQITMAQKATAPVDSSAYTITRRLNPLLSFSSAPLTAVNLITTYPKRSYPLVNDKDEPEIYPEFELELMNVVYAYLLEKLDDKKGLTWLAASEQMKNSVIAKIQKNSPVDSAVRVRRNLPAGYRPGLYG